MQKPVSSHMLVLVQLLSIGVGLFPFDGRQGSAWWLVAAVLGVAVGLYTLLHNRLGNFDIYPEPLTDATLVTSGPYRWVRHPMYLSLLLFMAGMAMFNGGLLNELSLLTLLLAVLGKIRKEERYLHRHFDGYGDYACNCKRLIPFVY